MKKLTTIILALLVLCVSCVPWNTGPEVKFVTPENGDEYQKGESIDVYIKATDGGGIEEVRLYLDGIGIASFTVFPFSYTLETTELEVGSHSLKAEVFDNYGKDASTDVGFTLTTGLPVVETLEPVLISENAVIAGGTIIDDGGGTISEAGILWSTLPYDIGGQQERSADVNEDIFSTALTNLNYVTYFITAYAENEVGRSFGEELSITVPEPEEEVP